MRYLPVYLFSVWNGSCPYQGMFNVGRQVVAVFHDGFKSIGT